MSTRTLFHGFFALLLAAALAGPARADDPPPAADHPDPTERSIIVPKGWEGAYEFGYAPLIRVGPQVIVSGIPAGGPGTYEEKVRRMYQRAVEVLATAGATVDDVVELTTFHAEPKDPAAFRAEFERYMPVHREFFGEHRPAWTAVGTTALLSPTAVVEMRIVAVVGSGANSRVVRPGEAAKPVEAGTGEEKPDAAAPNREP